MNKKIIPGIGRVILIASGKGGVGKSAISLAIAIALSQLGYKTAILDADIYGPSVPKMTGLDEKVEIENNLLIPKEKFDLKIMSLGFLVDAATAAIWRGPMATKVVRQLLLGVNWIYNGVPLDYLIIDMPPGTGDIHLSIAEGYEIAGAVIISTPQDIAIADARKAIDMYNKLSIPVLGIIENMSYFKDPNVGTKFHVFGQGGAEKLAKESGVALLGAIPLIPEFGASLDQGQPSTFFVADSELAVTFKDIAKQIALGIK